MLWHTGRTFYACPLCDARDERQAPAAAPATLPCWADRCTGVMTQWVPPSVVRDLAAAEPMKMAA